MVRPARVLAPPAALWRARPRPLRRLFLGHAPPSSGGGDSPAPQVTPFAARVPGGEELHRVGTLVKDGVLGASLLNPFLRCQPCDCRGPTKACTHVFGSAHCYDLGFDSALRGIPFFPFLVNMTFFQLFCPLLSRPWAGVCVVLSVASKVWLCTGEKETSKGLQALRGTPPRGMGVGVRVAWGYVGCLAGWTHSSVTWGTRWPPPTTDTQVLTRHHHQARKRLPPGCLPSPCR